MAQRNPLDRYLVDGPLAGETVRVVLPKEGIIKVADNRTEAHHHYLDAGFNEFRYQRSVPYREIKPPGKPQDSNAYE